LTLRALVAGCLLGVLFATANVYAGLKTAWGDSGNIGSAVLAFAAFSLLGKWGRSYSALENNLTQTVAAAAAMSATTAGLIDTAPALELLGHSFPTWSWIAWALCLSVVGTAVAAAIRERLIVTKALPFPTGAATAEVIQAMAAGPGTALRRALWLS